MRAWLAFPLLGIISPKTGALGRIPVLGSELEDSHFRKKKPKSRALYPLPMVRPRKGTKVISPHPLELLWSCSRRLEFLLCAGKRAFVPPPLGRGYKGCRRGSSAVCVLMGW